MSSDDAALVLQARTGDKNAFALLYDKYARLVRALCYDTTYDLEKAQDLAQDVFLRAYQKLAMLKNPERFAPWLVAMTKNVCREYQRSQARSRLTLINFDTDEFAKPAAQEDAANDHLDLLREAIERLPENERTALRVYYLQEQDLEKSMSILKLSRSSLYRLLEKAKKNVEAFFREHLQEP